MDAPGMAEQGALHLNYHLKMMANLAALVSHYDNNGPAVLKNATLEAMLIHARLLIEFIAGRPKSNPTYRHRNSQDLQPRDFGLATWDAVPNLNLDRYLYLADKYVAHLSKERFEAAPSGRAWAMGRMVNAILSNFATFAFELRNAGVVGAAETVEIGITEARALLTRPVMDWPPDLSN